MDFVSVPAVFLPQSGKEWFAPAENGVEDP